MKRNQRGATLLELVIGISLAMIIMIFAFEQFMPWLTFRQKFMTEMKLNEMQKSLLSVYHSKSSNIDRADIVGSNDFPYISAGNGGLIYFDKLNAAPLQTACDDPMTIETNRATLSRVLGNSDADFMRDAYGRDICVIVSKANVYDTGSVKIYYHTILFVSKGKNGLIDTKVNLDTGSFATRDPVSATEDVLNDDIVRVVSGYEIQREKFILALKRLDQTAQAFENYFQIQFLTDTQRDLLKNYFSSNAGLPTMFAPYDISIVESPVNSYAYQSPGRDVAAQTIWTSVFSKLGLALDDVKNPWISCDDSETQAACSNDFMVVIMDPNAAAPSDLSALGVPSQVRTPTNADAWFRLPPYNVILALDYPGRTDVTINPDSRFITKTAQAKY